MFLHEIVSATIETDIRSGVTDVRVQDVQADPCPAPSVPLSTKPQPQGFTAAPESPSPATAAQHPDNLRDWAAENAAFLGEHGFEALVKERRGRSNLNPGVGQLNHPAAGYLDYIRTHGAPVLTSTPPKSPEELQAAVDRGPHPSAEAHAEFLA